MLKPDRLETPAEYRRAFLILSVIAHGYVWGKYETVSDVRGIVQYFWFFLF